MNKNVRKYIKIFSVFAIFFAVFVLISPDITYAQNAQPEKPSSSSWFGGWFVDLVSIPINVLLLILAAVAYAVGFIGSGLLQLAAWLVEFFIVEMNSNILLSPTVDTGWKATKELANLGFVLGIIIIAFMTIIRYESYGAKQLLWRLIIAALLVNFSLTIAGVFIDFAGVLTDFFLSQITGGGANFKLSTQLAGAFAPQSFLQARSSVLEVLKSVADFNGALSFLTSMVFSALFTFLIAIALLVLAFMALIRFVILTFLLVLVPLAFLFWIFPMFQHLWSKWWGEFFKWVFFLPSALFFLYLALAIATHRSGYLKNLATLTQNKANFANLNDANSILTQSFFKNAGEALAILGFLYVGLILSHKISGTFSEVATKTGGWLSNKLQKATSGGGQAFALSATGGVVTQTYGRGARWAAGKMATSTRPRIRSLGITLGNQLGAQPTFSTTAKTVASSTWQGIKKGIIQKKIPTWMCTVSGCGYTVESRTLPTACPNPAHPGDPTTATFRQAGGGRSRQRPQTSAQAQPQQTPLPTLMSSEEIDEEIRKRQ